MRLFVVGSDKIVAIENLYVKYLKELGVDVYHFSAQSMFYDYYQKSFINKIIFRFGFSGIFEEINTRFKHRVESFKPDTILIFKGMEIFPETIKWAKNKKIKLINFNADNPFVFSGKGSGNKNVKWSIRLYDLHLTYNLAVQREIVRKYKIPTVILPFGFDISDELVVKSSKHPEVLKTCFLGNADALRVDFLQRLAEKGIGLDVYGDQWQKFLKHPNISIFPPVYGEEFWVVLRKYRVQLNLMRVHNLDSHNMRSFEVPGVGGIMVAPKTIEHEMYFENEKEVFLYGSVKDCSEIIKRLLNLSSAEANKIRQLARKRSIESAYTYKDRAKQLLTELKNL